MAKISQISQQQKSNTSKSITSDIHSSYYKTFDTTNVEKSWKHKARRKFYSFVLSQRLLDYEITIPKHNRGKWNNRIAFEYVPKVKLDENGNVLHVTNKYNEKQYVSTDIEKQPEQYYNHCNDIGNQLRWKRLSNCHSIIKQKIDKTTGELIYQASTKCNDKLCQNCSQSRSVIAIRKYQNNVQLMKSPVMVVLHQKSPGIGELKNTIDLMYNDWRNILKVRAKNKKENYNGICTLEVTTNEINKTYHPHYHIIIEKHQANDLVNEWILKDPKNRTKFAHTNKTTALLYTELPKDEKGNFNINELFKYAMKLSLSNRETPDNKYKTSSNTEMIYEIAKSLQNVQQWRPFGNFRNTLKTEEIKQIIQEEMTVNTSEFPHIHESPKWLWNKHDWEAINLKGFTLTGYIPSQKDIVFLRLSQQEKDFYLKNIEFKNKNIQLTYEQVKYFKDLFL